LFYEFRWQLDDYPFKERRQTGLVNLSLGFQVQGFQIGGHWFTRPFIIVFGEVSNGH